jgi:hypothetical protein
MRGGRDAGRAEAARGYGGDGRWGFPISRPLPGKDLSAWLVDHGAPPER